MHVARGMLAATSLALALATGCAPPVPRVVQGEALTTGNTTFDDFFTAVREVRHEAQAAPGDEQATHAGLIRALGLETRATPALALDEAGLRAKKLQEKGVLLHLEIAPEAKLVAARAKVDLGPDGEALLKAMEEGAKISLEMRKRLAAVAARATELEKRRIDLRAQAPAMFRESPQAKRDEVIVELDAAQGVLAEAAEKARNASGSAARFVVELAQAVETGAGAVPVEPPGKTARGGARKPPPPPAAAAAPLTAVAAAPKPASAAPPKAAPKQAAPAAAPAKKKPKGGDDFEP